MMRCLVDNTLKCCWSNRPTLYLPLILIRRVIRTDYTEYIGHVGLHAYTSWYFEREKIFCDNFRIGSLRVLAYPYQKCDFGECMANHREYMANVNSRWKLPLATNRQAFAELGHFAVRHIIVCRAFGIKNNQFPFFTLYNGCWTSLGSTYMHVNLGPLVFFMMTIWVDGSSNVQRI